MVIKALLALLLGPFALLVTAQDRLNVDRTMVIGYLIGNANTISIDTASVEAVFATMSTQPVEGYYHFSDVDFSPYCDSISYGYNCGPCMDAHLEQMLDAQWCAVGDGRYVNQKEWLMISRTKSDVTYYMKTISTFRSPGEGICGRIMLYATPYSKTGRKQLRQMARAIR